MLVAAGYAVHWQRCGEGCCICDMMPAAPDCKVLNSCVQIAFTLAVVTAAAEHSCNPRQTHLHPRLYLRDS